MGISIGLFVFAVGAILRYAVSTHVDGINLNVVGVILMIVGRRRNAGLGRLLE